MRRFVQTGPLVALAMLPAVIVAQGCFSSNDANPSMDASADVVIGMGDAQVDGPGATDSPNGPTDSPTDSPRSAPIDSPVDQAAPPPPAAGGTGAFGIVTVGGKQKMYLPEQYALSGGNASIAVVDVGAPGNGFNGAPAQLADIDLGSTDSASTTGGDSTVVIAASIRNNKIYFIDPVTDTLTKTITLDPSLGASTFSGGGGYVTGVAVDSAHHRAILSVYDGFAIVDLNTKTVSSVIQAPPSENFGFDSVHQWIIAPFYDCANESLVDDAGNPLYDDAGNTVAPAVCSSPMFPEGGVMSDGLSVIDLADDTVYTYEGPVTPPDAGPYFTYDPGYPVGSEPDSAAIDPTTGVAVVASEGGSFQNVIDFSKATFDKTTKTVTAPMNIIPSLNCQGVAIEPNKHFAFFEEEGTDAIAVADLTQANVGGQSAVQGIMPTVPGGGGFSNIGDPHGIAVTTSILGSGPVGFLVDSQYQWVARVDLAGLLAAGGTDGSAMLDDLQVAPFVTFLDALTPENPGTDAGDAASE